MVQNRKALQLSGIANKRSTTALSSFSYDYEKSGRITTWGRVLDGVASTWSFEYSRASELTGGTLKNASDQVTKTMRYLYDGSGNRVLKGEDTSSEYARYNSLNQLNKIGGKGPALIEGTVDEPSTVTVNGQRTETVQVPGTSTYRFERQIDAKEGSNTVEIEATDARNNTRTDQWQFTVGPVQKMLEYDLNGNLLNDGIRAFTWDAKNRLKSVVAGGVTYAWEYDGLDRRIREKRDGTLVKEWIWDGLQMIQERDGSGAVTKTFYDKGETVSGANYYFTGDHLGSVREMIDSTGAVRARYDYDLYGKRERLSGDLDADYGYTGHYWHSETGLYLAPYRAYDPELGRWISRDPAGEVADKNLYSYVGNNPNSRVDPSGLCKEEPVSPWHPDIIDDVADIINDSNWGTDDSHEEGGWITKDSSTGKYGVERWPRKPGTNAAIDSTPRPENAVGDVHTHPDWSGPTPGSDDPKEPCDSTWVITPKSIWKVPPKGKPQIRGGTKAKFGDKIGPQIPLPDFLEPYKNEI